MDGYDNGNNRDDERNNRDDNRPFSDPPICFGGVWGRAQPRRHCSEWRDAVIENVTSASILRFNSLPHSNFGPITRTKFCNAVSNRLWTVLGIVLVVRQCPHSQKGVRGSRFRFLALCDKRATSRAFLPASGQLLDFDRRAFTCAVFRCRSGTQRNGEKSQKNNPKSGAAANSTIRAMLIYSMLRRFQALQVDLALTRCGKSIRATPYGKHFSTRNQWNGFIAR